MCSTCYRVALQLPRGLWFSESFLFFFFLTAKLFQSPCFPSPDILRPRALSEERWRIIYITGESMPTFLSGNTLRLLQHTKSLRLNKHQIKQECSLSWVGLHKEQIYFTKMAYFQSLGDKCNLCLDHCWYRPLKLFLDGVTPRKFSTVSTMSDSHKAASLCVLMLPMFHSQKINSFCTYLFLPHGSLLCEKTLGMMELSKLFYVFPR